MIIKQNKRQTVFYLIFMVVLVAFCLCFVIIDWKGGSDGNATIADSVFLYWLFKVLCFLCCIVLAAASVYFVRQLFSKKPLIEICDEYFYDNSSTIALGRIEWCDIERVYSKGGYLNIKLKNPQKYFERKNWIQLMLIKSNLKLGYGDACITTQRFSKDAVKFIEEFRKRWENYNQ